MGTDNRLVEILRESLRQIEECPDPRKGEPIVVSVRGHMTWLLAELSGSAKLKTATPTAPPRK